MIATVICGCNPAGENDNQEYTIQLISGSFQYDVTASSNFVPQPFYKRNNDTITIHDYWALMTQPPYELSAQYANDTVHITCVEKDGIIKDWTPSVETTAKLVSTGSCNTLVFSFNAVRRARLPDSSETALGFRYAGNAWDTTVIY